MQRFVASRFWSDRLAAAEAATIPERTLVAADELGVRTQRGQWWLPG